MGRLEATAVTRQLRYTDAANEDIADITLYIADQSGSVEIAKHFAERLQDSCRRLAQLPGTLGTARPEVRADIRSTPYRDYVVFFRYVSDMVEIVAIFHSSRDIDHHFAV